MLRPSRKYKLLFTFALWVYSFHTGTTVAIFHAAPLPGSTATKPQNDYHALGTVIGQGRLIIEYSSRPGFDQPVPAGWNTHFSQRTPPYDPSTSYNSRLGFFYYKSHGLFPVSSINTVGMPLWFLMLLLAPATYFSAWRTRKLRPILFRDLCPRCGYSLQGATSPSCPECGEKLPPSPNPPTATS